MRGAVFWNVSGFIIITFTKSRKVIITPLSTKYLVIFLPIFSIFILFFFFWWGVTMFQAMKVFFVRILSTCSRGKTVHICLLLFFFYKTELKRENQWVRWLKTFAQPFFEIVWYLLPSSRILAPKNIIPFLLMVILYLRRITLPYLVMRMLFM